MPAAAKQLGQPLQVSVLPSKMKQVTLVNNNFDAPLNSYDEINQYMIYSIHQAEIINTDESKKPKAQGNINSQ